MDAIVQQLTQIIKQNEKIEDRDAEFKAVKEILLSGLSRSGFLKENLYLNKFDFQYKDIHYLCFLNQHGDEKTPVREYLPFIEIELDAAEISGTVIEKEKGIEISTDQLKLFLYIINENYELKSSFLYQQAPIPYEIRSVSSMNEGIHGEIEKRIDRDIKVSETVEKKERTTKVLSKNKKKKDDAQVQQLSLFDL